MEIWTDGTMQPGDALTRAARILQEHFTPIVGHGVLPAEGDEDEEETKVGNEYYDVPIEDLDLAMRAYNCLKRSGITNVGEILERLDRGVNEMLAIRNFGQKSLIELVDRMKEKGYLPEQYEIED
jgi:DNA-directed RNA polymerase subunit alpha